MKSYDPVQYVNDTGARTLRPYLAMLKYCSQLSQSGSEVIFTSKPLNICHSHNRKRVNKYSKSEQNILNYYSIIQNQLTSERITCKSRPTNDKFKANFARLQFSVLVLVARTGNYGNCEMHQSNSSRA